MDATYRTLAGAAELGEFTVGLLATQADVKPATVRTVLNRNRHLFERSPGASARRGGQPQVWSVREEARGELAAAIAAIGDGFLADVEPAASMEDHGSTLRLRPTGVNPELVKADDLHAYPLQAERAAQELLPHLVRLLLAATPGVASVTMRTGDGIRLPGLDGRADATVSAGKVPAGFSAWELGTSRDPGRKAQEDYRKRTLELDDTARATTTFVAVSMRRFPKAEAWAARRKAERAWRDVLVLDADDLYTWLEASPAVHFWVSERMGLHPSDAETLDQWWRTWQGQTWRGAARPALPAELMLAGRDTQVKELWTALGRSGEVITVSAGSRQEATAFVAAALLEPNKRDVAGKDDTDEWSARPDRLARTLLVSTPRQWARLVGARTPLVLIPGFDEPDVGAATRAGHSVLVPLGSGDDQERATIPLPRLARDVARDMLHRHGWDLEEADHLAAQARRSLPSVRRKLAAAPVYAKPPWTERADVLAPLVLAGSWSKASKTDHAIIAAITSRPYPDVERELRKWMASDDSPFLLSGGVWQLSAIQDAWSLLCHALTDDDLDRWENAAFQVLTEPDPALTLPPADRPFAGLGDIKRVYSPSLRAGLARGAALLAAAADEAQTGDRTWADHPEALVGRLLTEASDANAWSSLTDVLPSLAEAAPETFLRAATAGCLGSEPTLRGIFADGDSDMGWGASSPHTGLLWALESLCWSDKYAPEACEVLALLTKVDPGGKLANRPDRSLRDVLLSWHPQTAASPETRLEIVASILRRHPEFGWRLLLSLLPQPYDSSTPTHSPLFRDWKPTASKTTLQDVLTSTDALITFALRALRDQPQRWSEFITGMTDLPSDELTRCIDQLADTDPGTLDESARLDVWKVLTETISQHRASPTARWALADPVLHRLEEVSARWEPRIVERHARLFDWHPTLPGTARNTSERDAALAQARAAAISEALTDSSGEGLDDLIAHAPEPLLVGVALAEATRDQHMEMMLGALGDQGPARRATSGWVRRMSELGGPTWIEQTLSQARRRPEPTRVRLYLALAPTPAIWTAVAADTAKVADQYWQQIPALAVSGREVVAFASHLVDHHRPWSAINLLSLEVSQSEDHAPVSLLIRALEASCEPGVTELPRPGSVEYEVGLILDRIHEAGVDEETLFKLEWQYFTVLEHHRQPKTLYTALARDPRLFVDLVCTAFRAEDEPPTELDAAAAAKARQSYALLRSWRRPPGSNDDGSIDENALRAWINLARDLLADKGRGAIGDECIGEVLSGSPPGADGIWPPQAIRDILEALASPKLSQGIAIGEFNAANMVTRTHDGGRAEAARATKYEEWSRQVMVRWPETGRMLRDMAKDYRVWARRFEAEAERWADSG